MEKQDKKIRNKLISGSVTVFLILAVCLCLFAFVQVINKGYVSFFGNSFFKVTTGSMEPTIPVGALILTKDIEINDIEINDVISFFSKEAYMNGRIITHRVVAKETSGTGQVLLTTRGDANSSTDIHRVDSDNLIGKVVWVSSDGNFFANILGFLSSRTGFFACIAIPAIMISVFIFKRIMQSMMVDIKRLKSTLDNPEQDNQPSEDSVLPKPTNQVHGMSDEEYEEMYSRIRAELIEELNSGNDREQSKNQ
ncbi:MAG: signal peptidase I [Clostridia bacterium]|nr:signal peptidase I [Clostridia bacterium]